MLTGLVERTKRYHFKALKFRLFFLVLLCLSLDVQAQIPQIEVFDSNPFRFADLANSDIQFDTTGISQQFTEATDLFLGLYLVFSPSSTEYLITAAQEMGMSSVVGDVLGGQVPAEYQEHKSVFRVRARARGMDGEDNPYEYGVFPNLIGLTNIELLLPGDYNYDGVVNLTDYTVWRDSLGDTGPVADGSEDGLVSAADQTYWRSRFGNSLSTASSRVAAVPEPASGFFISILGLVALVITRQVPRNQLRRE